MPRPKPKYKPQQLIKCPQGIATINFIMAIPEGYQYHTDCGWYYEEELEVLGGSQDRD